MLINLLLGALLVGKVMAPLANYSRNIFTLKEILGFD